MDSKISAAGLKLGKIGLGIEHFARGSRVPELSRDENSKLIIEEAYAQGITHYDLVFNLPYFFEIFQQFLKDKRNKITFTTHLGSFYDEKHNGHIKTRSLKKIKFTYEDMLERLDVDYADIALIQFITHYDDFEKMMKNGVFDYAKELKRNGQSKAIGMSAHKPQLLKKIISQIDLDVVMLPVNFATGFRKEMKELLATCKQEGIGVIAIKNLLKGNAFTTKTSTYSAYYTMGKKFKLRLDTVATPAECINYALDLGVDTVAFGVKNVDELKTNMESYKLQDKTRNYKYFEQIFKQTLS